MVIFCSKAHLRHNPDVIAQNVFSQPQKLPASRMTAEILQRVENTMRRQITTSQQSATGVIKNAPSLEARNGRLSQFVHQITATDAESLGNPQEGVHRNCAMSVFQKGKEHNRQASFFGEFFLSHFQPFALRANGLSQDATV